MSEKANIASELFKGGKNCSQSVFGAFCQDYHLDQETAFKLACGLGGGARNAELCGAVSGAVLVLGLKYGESKEICNAKTEEFTAQFRKENGSIVCRNILGCDISTPAGKEKALQENLFKTKCVDMVASAAQILEDLG